MVATKLDAVSDGTMTRYCLCFWPLWFVSIAKCSWYHPLSWYQPAPHPTWEAKGMGRERRDGAGWVADWNQLVCSQGGLLHLRRRQSPVRVGFGFTHFLVDFSDLFLSNILLDDFYKLESIRIFFYFRFPHVVQRSGVVIIKFECLCCHRVEKKAGVFFVSSYLEYTRTVAAILFLKSCHVCRARPSHLGESFLIFVGSSQSISYYELALNSHWAKLKRKKTED